jgi:drug/metabolite transporter (DMT)-like permease
MVGACLSFSMMVAISKVLGAHYDTAQQVFFRNFVGVLFVVVSLVRRPAVHVGGKPLLLVMRGVIGTLSLYLLIYSIGTLGMARSVTYQYTYPLFMALAAFAFLRERPAKREIFATLLGLSGIWLLFRPDMQMPLDSHVLGLSNALLTTVAYLAIRELSRYYDPRFIVLSFMLSGIVLPLLSMIAGQFFIFDDFSFLLGHFVWPVDVSHWLLFVGLGVTALVGQVLMTHAFARGRPTQVAPVGYTSILFSTLLGLYLGESIPDILLLAGMSCIVAGGILITAFPKQ